jgi:hypothetical protein
VTPIAKVASSAIALMTLLLAASSEAQPAPSNTAIPPWSSAALGVASRGMAPSRPGSRARVSYSGEAWATFGVSLLLTPVFGVGVLGLLFGGPAVQWVHGHTGRGFAVLGMNVGGTLAGFGLGWAVACGGSRCRGELGGYGILIGGTVGAAVGLLVTNIVNAAVLSDEDPPELSPSRARRAPGITLAPQIDLSPDRGQLGVVGTF